MAKKGTKRKDSDAAKKRAAARRTVLYKRFASVYVTNGRNATQAYLTTHPHVQHNTAGAEGFKLLNNPEVIDEIKVLTAAAWKREHMEGEEALARAARVARMDIGDYYWKPGELDRAGLATTVNQRKPLSELTDEQRTCIKGYKYTTTGLVIQEHYDAMAQLANIMKHKRLLSDNVNVNLTMPLDKMIEASYGENKEPS